jgi:hypothetical protein
MRVAYSKISHATGEGIVLKALFRGLVGGPDQPLREAAVDVDSLHVDFQFKIRQIRTHREEAGRGTRNHTRLLDPVRMTTIPAVIFPKLAEFFIRLS